MEERRWDTFQLLKSRKKWNVSERSVRNYCAHGRMQGAFLTGKPWNIPEKAEKPERANKKKEHPPTLLDILQEEKASKYDGGIYHKTQIDLTYNSNHMEGSGLTYDQTRYIFETNTIGVENEVLNVDDVIETVNRFRCIDMIIGHVKAALTDFPLFLCLVPCLWESAAGRQLWFPSFTGPGILTSSGLQ